MRLFEINDQREVQLNKPWIYLIPEFKVLITRDKGSKGDYDGRHKKKAIQDFTFIYFFCDFNSPIRDYEENERMKEAVYYAGLDESEVGNDDELWIAVKSYESLLLKTSRSLRTYKALLKAQDALDDYYENLDFSKTDKQGKLLHTPESITGSGKKLKEFRAGIKEVEKAVEEELREGGTKIQGKAEKGINEDKFRTWSESEIGTTSDRQKPKNSGTPDMRQLAKQMAASTVLSELDEEDTDNEGEE
jgi:hypothetical protein